jgi:hypothetical protein
VEVSLLSSRKAVLLVFGFRFYSFPPLKRESELVPLIVLPHVHTAEQFLAVNILSRFADSSPKLVVGGIAGMLGSQHGRSWDCFDCRCC